MARLTYREVQVKGILNPVRGEDDWFGLSYNMNLYRGCEHQCIYCDTRSTCYQIENFDEEVLVKANALDLLEDALPRKRKLGVIGFGSMNDPYTYAEERWRLWRNIAFRGISSPSPTWCSKIWRPSGGSTRSKPG